MKEQMNQDMTVCLSQQEIDRIYYRQQRIYWEADFINRCLERRAEETGLCNLNYETLPDDSALLDTAYEMYQKKEDCNIAYNDTLDTVIDEIESGISKGMYQKTAGHPVPEKIILLMDEKEVVRVLCQSPEAHVLIAEIDRFAASQETLDAILAQTASMPGFYPASLSEAANPGDITAAMQDAPKRDPRVAVVIDNGIISCVKSTDPSILVEITELDKDYASFEEINRVYDTIAKDPDLQDCLYHMEIPGYETEETQEEDE